MRNLIHRSKSLSAGYLFYVLFLVVGCGGGGNSSGETEEENPRVPPSTEVLFYPSERGLQLDLGDNQAAQIQFYIKNGNDAPSIVTNDVTIASDDIAIATVNQGTVTAVSAGMTVIRAHYLDHITSVTVVVSDVVSPNEPTLSVVPSTLNIKVGDNAGVVVSDVALDGTTTEVDDAIFWQVADSSIATIDSDNVVQALKVGTTMAVGIYQNRQVTLNIAVTDINQGAAITEIMIIEPSQAQLASPSSLVFSAVGKTSSGSTVPLSNVTWEAISENLISVDSNGAVTALDPTWGYATVSALYQGHRAAITLENLGGAAEINCDASNVNQVTVHYQRADNDYQGWGLHLWTSAGDVTEWDVPRTFDGNDGFGKFATINVADLPSPVNFIVHKGNIKDTDEDRSFPCGVSDIYLISDDVTVYTAPPASTSLTSSRAIFVDEKTFYIPGVAGQATLHHSANAELRINNGQVEGGESISLQKNGGQQFIIAGLSNNELRELFKQQIWIEVDTGEITGVQIAQALDSLYTYNGKLGPEIRDNGSVDMQVWAPTAQAVAIWLFDNSNTTAAEMHAMNFDIATGVWHTNGDANWVNKYYLYDVKVFHPETQRIERYFVTDPYSVSLSENSKRSQIVDLNDASLKPSGWDEIKKEGLTHFEDAVIYELHTRDFSSSASDVAELERGTYKAFADTTSAGHAHLKSLSEAGLTHLHLLPTMDIATINETKSEWKSVTNPSELTGATEKAAEIAGEIRTDDAFNWGYDPYHYGVPEGSYSTQPDGSQRILEYREMVKALDAIGLKVVMDVVYNHTMSSGMWQQSVLDRVVPGYYHRLDANGHVEASSCCEDTASENKMMAKLMVDTLVRWAKHYKIDAFRFDLMGHHLKQNILDVRNAMDALTLANDGVDGENILLYGEGWNFGGLVERGKENMNQFNAGGTGIGTYNDRIRDAVTGGVNETGLTNPGFVHGNYVDREKVIIGLAGNLVGYRGDANGVGYAQDPQENIVYITKHDNYTLWDLSTAKLSRDVSMEDRVRIHNLAVALSMLGQGIPFMHAGVDLLRSKSGDRNSYDSGDWYNKVDFSGQENNWGSGLPPAWDNINTWAVWRPLLSDSNLKPRAQEMSNSANHFKELLSIRQDVDLLRLTTREQIENHVRFENQDTGTYPGVIAYKVFDSESAKLDDKYWEVMVIFNAQYSDIAFHLDFTAGQAFELHAMQASLQGKARFESGTFFVPKHTAAVFVVKK